MQTTLTRPGLQAHAVQLAALRSSMTPREFEDAHVEALHEGAEQVESTLRAFREVLGSRPTRSDLGTARILLERARKEIESFDVKDDE